MNIFIKYINENKINSEIELKRLFWKLSKKVHPDITCITSNNDQFIELKKDFDQASLLLKKGLPKSKIQNASICKEDCIDIFLDLMACNFPIEKSVINKTYTQRIKLLNSYINKIIPTIPDVFLKFQDEIYLLKYQSDISNHLFHVVKLYLYRYCDYIYLSNKNNKNYLIIGYDLVYEILVTHKMVNSIIFINWLLEEILIQIK